MHIRDYQELKEELLGLMTSKGIKDVGDYDTYAARLRHQWCLSDCYFMAMDSDSKRCAMASVSMSQVSLKEGEGVDEAADAFKFDLSNLLISEIQEYFMEGPDSRPRTGLRQWFVREARQSPATRPRSRRDTGPEGQFRRVR